MITLDEFNEKIYDSYTIHLAPSEMEGTYHILDSEDNIVCANCTSPIDAFTLGRYESYSQKIPYGEEWCEGWRLAEADDNPIALKGKHAIVKLIPTIEINGETSDYNEASEFEVNIADMKDAAWDDILESISDDMLAQEYNRVEEEENEAYREYRDYVRMIQTDYR